MREIKVEKWKCEVTHRSRGSKSKGVEETGEAGGEKQENLSPLSFCQPPTNHSLPITTLHR